MIEKIKEKWDEILLHIKEEHELTDVSFKTWLLPTQPYSMKDGTLQILVPDVQFLGYIKKKYGLLIQITIEELTGIECEVDFVTIEQVDEPQKETDKSHLINRPNVSCYVTPYGQMIVGVTTDRIKINEGPDHLKIQIDYTLELNYEQTSQSHIEIDVKSKATAKLNLKEQ